jgi:ATP-dependent protease ClpP protease subunit
MPRTRKPDFNELLTQVHSFNVNLYTRELYLHSYFGVGDDEPGVEYRMATSFIKNLHILEQQSSKPVLIHMHTVGGEWADGMAIYDAIAASPCPTTILAYAQASSMSGIILQAAGRRVLMPNCEFLLHFGSIGVESNSIAAKSAIDWNHSLHDVMLDAFVQRAINAPRFEGKTDLEVKQELSENIRKSVDWFLTAKDAISYGLADGILGTRGYETIAKLRG